MQKNSKIMGKNVNHYSLAVLLTLYLAQGLPVGFMTQALPTLLRHYGVSLTQIGVSGLLMLPWAIKFLWAPYVDHYGIKRIGHYRSWILFTQVTTIICLIILAFLPVEQLNQLSDLWSLFIVLWVLNTLCATQDIATDGLAVNILKYGQVHWGNTFQVMGSRLGFILGGGAVLYFIDLLSWQITFLALAIGVLLNSIPILFYKEPAFTHSKKMDEQNNHSLIQKFKHLYGHLWSSSELRCWLMVILTYKVADGLSGPIIKPMMVDMDLSLSQIGIYVTMFGAVFALIGALLAGWLIKYFTLPKMFILFSIFQSLTFIYYIVLAYCFEHDIPFDAEHLYIANAIEELFSAMGLVTMLSIIMLYARSKFAATDFTLQVALMTVVSGGLYVIGGGLADYLGYWMTFLIILMMSLLCLLPKLYWLYQKKSF